MSIAKRTGWYFTSSIVVPLLGILSLPIFTLKLGSEQYGVYAIASSLATVVSAASGSFSYLSLSAQLNSYNDENRRLYLGAVLLIGVLFSLIFSFCFLLVYFVLGNTFGLELLSRTAVILTFVGAFFGSVWSICVEILTIQGRAKDFSLSSIAQTLANVITVCVMLFVFDSIKYALLWGFVCASLVGALGAYVSLHGNFTVRNLHHWVPIAWHGGGYSVFASLMENGKNAVERYYIGLVNGANQLGLLAHGQYYKNATMIVVNAISRGLVPTIMLEAKEGYQNFSTSMKIWTSVQIMIVVITLCFTLVGRELIGILTHDKFVEAYPYAIAMMSTLLLQTMAKPQSTLLLVRGKGKFYSNLNTASAIMGLIILFITVPYFGVWGAIIATVFQIITLRAALFWVAHRITPIPFADYWVIVGLVLTGFCVVIDHFFNLNFLIRLLMLFFIYLFIYFKVKKEIIALVNHTSFRNLLSLYSSYEEK